MRFEKTVLQVIPRLDGGGAERTTLEITEAILAAGGRAIIAAAGGRLVAAVQSAGGEFVTMPLASKNPLDILANARRIAELVRAENIDIIHARSRAPAWSALFAARRTGAAFVTTYHGAYKRQSALKRLYNSSMIRGDVVIANSQFTAEAVRDAGVGQERIAVIARGADVEIFNPEAISTGRLSALREKWTIGKVAGRTLFLLPGRLTAWKGHETAIRAIDLLRRRTGVCPPLQLIFAGDEQGRGNEARRLMRLVEELGLQEMIRWVGHCDDMPAAYALSDTVLSPSTRPEAFGRIAVEAGAMGKVVIASAHGGNAETIIDGDTGILVEPASAAALADGIDRAVALGSEGLHRMGANARRRVAGHYSTSRMKELTIATYQRVLEGRAGAA